VVDDAGFYVLGIDYGIGDYGTGRIGDDTRNAAPIGLGVGCHTQHQKRNCNPR
jgi:hypothetical protein